MFHLENQNWQNYFKNCADADEMWIAFRLYCNDLFHAFVPLSDRKADRTFSYPSFIRKMIRKKAQLHKQRFQSENHMIKYKAACKKCKFALKKFHLRREEDVVEKGLSSVYKYVRSRLNYRPSVTQLECDGEMYSDNVEVANILNDQYCSVFCSDDGRVPDLPVQCENYVSECIITRASVISSIRQLKNGSSGGVDGMPTWFFKTFSEQLSVPLQMIFQNSFDTGIVPKEWKMAVITPVFKGGKNNSSSPASYRPISLTCIACRVMERILKQFLTSHCELNNLFSKHQHGFRSKRSTETQLLECFNDWSSNVDFGEAVDVLYLDISKAFDTVSHSKLIYKLSQYGIHGNFIRWISAFLSDRSQAVRVDSVLSAYERVVSGVPQGSVLGPFLFLLFINDLPRVCQNSSIKMFADDSKIYFKCTDPADRTKLNDDIVRVFDWFHRNQLKVAVEKCAVLHLGSSNPKYRYQIHNTVLPSVESMKDIGVIMSSNMKFSNHCSFISDKAFKMSNMFFRVFKSRNLDFMLRFFTTYIRSLVESNSSVWNPHLLKDIRKLESVQRKFTKRLPGFHHLSYESRLEKLGLDTLEARRLRNDLSMCYKIVYKLADIDMNAFFTFSGSGLSRNRHPKSFQLPRCKLDCRKFAFSSRTIAPWNSLPPKVINSTNLSIFKANLRQVDLSRYLKY